MDDYFELETSMIERRFQHIAEEKKFHSAFTTASTSASVLRQPPTLNGHTNKREKKDLDPCGRGVKGNYSRYYYLPPSIRPNDWKEAEDVRKKVSEILKPNGK